MEKQVPKHPCPLCGGTEFVEGRVHAPLVGCGFLPDKKDAVIPTPKAIRALSCKACGHLVLLTAPWR
ncbi:MAG TPA: hypothetical protein VMF30_02980 [Pirellulales bacterium]|nr:hypothetical protein [Pirellulales bacterium]